MNLIFQLLLSFALLGIYSSESCKEKITNEVSMTIKSHTLNNGNLDLIIEITNNSSKPISILKPRPIKSSNYFNSTVPPDFFTVNFKNQVEECVISEPANSGTTYIKTKNDILIIEANSTSSFTLKCSHYDVYHCEEDFLDVEINYLFDKTLLDRTNFQETIAKKGRLNKEQSDELFQLISTTYQEACTASKRIIK